LQKSCLSIGARCHNNVTRETRLCLCKGAHHRARTRLGSAFAEPSLPGGLEGWGTSPKSLTPFLVIFRKKISTPNSLVLRQDKKPEDQKLVSRPKGRSSRENGLRLWATATPSPPFARRAALAPKKFFAFVQERDRGQRLRNIIEND